LGEKKGMRSGTFPFEGRGEKNEQLYLKPTFVLFWF